MTVLFSLTIFTSSFLIFCLQPMVTKQVLPIFGGSPSVWTTAMLFFQIFLLLGYLYSHYLTGKINFKKGIVIHLLILALALIFILIFLIPTQAGEISLKLDPVASLFLLLLTLVGLPFFVGSASSPLLQYWYGQAGTGKTKDPYFLYVSSNIGSFCALLCYPLILEPFLTLRNQRHLWLGLYILQALLFLFCGWRAWPKNLPVSAGLGEKPTREEQRPSRRLRGRWLLLSFIPSSLMLGVTSHLATDIASIPLMWVIPLALYLLSFVIVFSQKLAPAQEKIGRIFPVLVLVTAFIILTDIESPLWLIIIIFLSVFFMAALVCHGQLAASRPGLRYLTTFYLYLAVGGMLGGLFNAVVAPLIFQRVTEFPMVLALSAMVYIRNDKTSGSEKLLRRLWPPLAAGLIASLLAIFVPRFTLEPYQLWMGVIFGIPLIFSYLWVHDAFRYGLAIGAVFLGSIFYVPIHGKVLFQTRNFFGCLQVNVDSRGPYHKLFHGTTIHGLQFIDSAEKRREPLAYYHRLGPLGEIFFNFGSRLPKPEIGVIGLGVGSMLSYATSQQTWTFFEIDPDVIRIAQNTRYFSYWQDSLAQKVNIMEGDARLELQKIPDSSYGLFIIDAFNSDTIPTHLLTKEAFALYFRKLSSHGILAMNISNKNLDLTQVIANIARSLGVFSVQQRDSSEDFSNPATKGKFRSQWAIMVRQPEDLGPLLQSTRWFIVPPRPDQQVWSDDYSNIITLLRWR